MICIVSGSIVTVERRWRSGSESDARREGRAFESRLNRDVRCVPGQNTKLLLPVSSRIRH